MSRRYVVSSSSTSLVHAVTPTRIATKPNNCIAHCRGKARAIAAYGPSHRSLSTAAKQMARIGGSCVPVWCISWSSQHSAPCAGMPPRHGRGGTGHQPEVVAHDLVVVAVVVEAALLRLVAEAADRLLDELDDF